MAIHQFGWLFNVETTILTRRRKKTTDFIVILDFECIDYLFCCSE